MGVSSFQKRFKVSSEEAYLGWYIESAWENCFILPAGNFLLSIVIKLTLGCNQLPT